MSPVLFATIAGLITAFCWGASDWLGARSAKKLTPIEVNFAVQVPSLIMVAGLFALAGFDQVDAGQLARIVLSSLLITAAYLIFIRALKSGAVGIVVPLSNIYPLFTLILSIIFLQAYFSSPQLGAMVGIVLGASLLAYEKNHRKIPLKELHRETILSLAAAAIWGLAFFAVNPVITQVSWQTITIISELVACALALVLLVAASPTKTLAMFAKPLTSRSAITAGILGVLGFMALYFGSSRSGSVVIPAVLSVGSTLVSSFLGLVIDHEKIGVLKRVGAFVVVAGIIILNIT